MTDKILSETLIALDVYEYKHKGGTLSYKAQKWITQNGMPNIEAIFKKQQVLFNATKEEKIQFYIDRLKDAAKRGYKLDNEETVMLCKEAYEVGVSQVKIARSLKVSRSDIKNIVKPSEEYIKINGLLKKGYKKHDPKMIRLYKKYYRNGTSLYSLTQWSGTTYKTMRKLLGISESGQALQQKSLGLLKDHC